MSNTTKDFCTFVPDSPLGFSFGAACALHDNNYGPGSGVSRAAADQIFYDAMQQTCHTQYGGSALCHAMADVYFIGVRLFGGFFYEGPGGQ